MVYCCACLGLWLGFILGLGAQNAALLYFIVKLDWEDEANDVCIALQSFLLTVIYSNTFSYHFCSGDSFVFVMIYLILRWWSVSNKCPK